MVKTHHFPRVQLQGCPALQRSAHQDPICPDLTFIVKERGLQSWKKPDTGFKEHMENRKNQLSFKKF